MELFVLPGGLGSHGGWNGGGAGMLLGAYLLLEVEGPGAYFPQEPPSSSPYQWVTPLPEHPSSSWTQMSVLRTPGAEVPWQTNSDLGLY